MNCKFYKKEMKERILKEIEKIQTYIEDCTEERNSLLNHVDNVLHMGSA